MNEFWNGRQFRRALKCYPPPGHPVPVVSVEMAARPDQFVPVMGKVDTGAFRTVLTFETAMRLGIRDPKSSPIRVGMAQTATGEEVSYFVHTVSVRIVQAVVGFAEGARPEDPKWPAIEFPLAAAFVEKAKRNQFGVDWLHVLCLAVDSQAVHFLAD